MAPEVIQSRPYNEKVDMYGFGVIMWQVATGGSPYQGFGRLDITTRVAGQGERPSLDMRYKNQATHPNLPYKMKKILQGCWCPNIQERMTAEDALAVLSSLLSAEVIAAGHPSRRSCFSRIFRTD